jgi:hypothetical protein
MSYPDFEYRAERIAVDLNVGNANDAANVLRDELYRQPWEAGALINRANQLSSPARRDDIIVDRIGDVSVRDRYTGYSVYAGRLDNRPYPGYPVPIPIPIPIPFPYPYPRHGYPHHPPHYPPHHPPHHRW